MLRDYRAYDDPRVTDYVSAVAVNPKGDLILTGLGKCTAGCGESSTTWTEGSKTTVNIWQADNGKHIASFPTPNKEVWQAEWDPKGRFAAFSESGALILWQPETEKNAFIKIPLSENFSAFALSPDGNLLAATDGTTVTVYDIKDVNMPATAN